MPSHIMGNFHVKIIHVLVFISINFMGQDVSLHYKMYYANIKF